MATIDEYDRQEFQKQIKRLEQYLLGMVETINWKKAHQNKKKNKINKTSLKYKLKHIMTMSCMKHVNLETESQIRVMKNMFFIGEVLLLACL